MPRAGPALGDTRREGDFIDRRWYDKFYRSGPKRRLPGKNQGEVKRRAKLGAQQTEVRKTARRNETLPLGRYTGTGYRVGHSEGWRLKERGRRLLGGTSAGTSPEGSGEGGRGRGGRNVD